MEPALSARHVIAAHRPDDVHPTAWARFGASPLQALPPAAVGEAGAGAVLQARLALMPLLWADHPLPAAEKAEVQCALWAVGSAEVSAVLREWRVEADVAPCTMR